MHPRGPQTSPSPFFLRPAVTDEPLAQQLIALRALLGEVEARLARAPVTPAGLEDLKASVDTLRTTIWAIISAGHGKRSDMLVERFKARRAIDTLQSLSSTLAAGGATTSLPDYAELGRVARTLADRIDSLR